MIRPDTQVNVYLCREPVDMRKSIDGLSLLVQEAMALNPFEQAVFVFCNRQRDKVKILAWERNGFVLWYKRLEQERFKWPARLQGDTLTLSGQELNWLLDGYDIALMRPHKALHYQAVG
ncbi:IS66 family insertion sequence element accessory protein TnpB [Alkalilimnicola ehrlichii MLHE-1]|uniref:IS66 Orf2 family protein n=1 Tax=Alkalilimnicola ehrlichii (strain ATCC BAA-1101 / DSM 17681 / MLHE-1) TaxID=187272 RepID=Q0A7Q9_ALKEH|nr:IS66 family insertion sequence element accessory protein TnpB [Alkalilimnicola ehrlichii]ABI57128.1 IS66 Orf2 family protein [Alkalilimnicola ehrlichii MLHE-1]